MAIGEAACVSVHGANRLGSNSLLDLVVFGKEAGKRAAEYAKGRDYVALPRESEARTRQSLDALLTGSGSERVADIRSEMQTVMFDKVGVFRTQEGMTEALEKIRELRERCENVSVDDRSQTFNTELLEALELSNLLDCALVTTASALNRTESRGAHARDDYSERDDENWLKHTLAFLEPDGEVSIRYKPVTITQYEPMKRVY